MKNFFKKIIGKIIRKNNQKGFTVLESLIAILIVAVSTTAAFSSVEKSLSSATYSKDEVRAFFLAQEAVEAIRNVRDRNNIASSRGATTDWLAGIAAQATDPCYFGKTCTVDAAVVGFAFASCGTAWDCSSVLRQSPTTYVYGYNAGADGVVWVDTRYKREVQLEQISSDQISVTVQVSWTKGIIPYKFKAKTLLFKWL